MLVRKAKPSNLILPSRQGTFNIFSKASEHSIDESSVTGGSQASCLPK
jgi:hypothetical protein